MQETITKYFADRAFGFIKPDGSRSDVFFNKSAMAGGTVPAVDMVVEFVEEMGSNGRPRAVNVKPI
jgi:cold shock CspA family protein